MRQSKRCSDIRLRQLLYLNDDAVTLHRRSNIRSDYVNSSTYTTTPLLCTVAVTSDYVNSSTYTTTPLPCTVAVTSDCINSSTYTTTPLPCTVAVTTITSTAIEAIPKVIQIRQRVIYTPQSITKIVTCRLRFTYTLYH